MTMPATDAKEPRGGSRVARSVVGAIAVLLGIVSLVGGSALVVIHETQRDADGLLWIGIGLIAAGGIVAAAGGALLLSGARTHLETASGTASAEPAEAGGIS
jgi:hypothetical protein